MCLVPSSHDDTRVQFSNIRGTFHDHDNSGYTQTALSRHKQCANISTYGKSPPKRGLWSLPLTREARGNLINLLSGENRIIEVSMTNTRDSPWERKILDGHNIPSHSKFPLKRAAVDRVDDDSKGGHLYPGGKICQ